MPRETGGSRYFHCLNAFHNWQKTNYMSGNAKLLYYELLGLFNEARWPESVRLDNYRLMWMVDTRTEKVAIAARDKLVEHGFIRYKKGRKGRPNEYTLAEYTPEKASVYDSVSDSEKDSERVSASAGQRVRHIKTLDKDLKKDLEKDSIPPVSPKGDPPPAVGRENTGFGPELQAAFERWLGYKRERREGYKPTGLKCLVTQIHNAAKEYGDSAVIAVIEQSMASGYRGIVFDRLRARGRVQDAARDPIPDYKNFNKEWSL